MHKRIKTGKIETYIILLYIHAVSLQTDFLLARTVPAVFLFFVLVLFLFVGVLLCFFLL